MRGGAPRALSEVGLGHMTTAWFNCASGVAGDMLLGALVDAGADPVVIADVLAGLPLDDYALSFESTQRCGVTATRAIVAVHQHEHTHRPWRDIRHLIESSSLPTTVAARALAVFARLADVEARIHGVHVDDVEFHEVGGTDAIVDIVGVCAAVDALNISTIVCSPIAVGHGRLRSAHGELPNPAPAVTRLLAEASAPVIGLDDVTELSTPTGVALMVTLADAFGSMPTMTPNGVGFGAGSRDLPGRANVVNVVLGHNSTSSLVPTPGQLVRLLETNLDDVTGEVIAHVIAQLMTAGAHDAWVTPIVMKKGRAAYTVHVLCSPDRSDALAEVLVRETGTLGVRGSLIERWPQQRTDTTVVIDGHEIRVKLGSGRAKIEFDDAAKAAAALGRPVRDILARAEQALM